MKVFGSCKSCGKEVFINTRARTRVGLAKAKGNEVPIGCGHCNLNNSFAVDELYAKKNKVTLTVSLLILITGTPVIFYLVNYVMSNPGQAIYFPYLLLLTPSIVFGIIQRAEAKRVSSFNNYKLKGRIPGAR